jgi:hypothetical protein
MHKNYSNHIKFGYGAVAATYAYGRSFSYNAIPMENYDL